MKAPTERSADSDPPGDDRSPTLIVGVGASAGGLGACQQLLEGAPADRGLAFVIVLHLSPDGESRVAEILQKGTSMKVSQVTGNERVEPDHVYVIAPGTSLSIRGGALDAGAPEEPHFRARPVDAFFAALAAEREGDAVGIVLSGTGGDGAAGLQEIRKVGGLCLVQDPDTAEYPGMPRSAIAAGVVDAVVAPEEMGEVLLRYAGTPRERPAGKKADAAAAETAGGLPEVLALLREHYGVDFRDYKSGMLMRRTQRRIELKHLSGFRAYVDHLKAHPKEIDELYRDLLIGVTTFFRDAEEWALLADEIVPELVGRQRAGRALRVWSAGCATGEEAYGLAMIFLEHLDTRRGAEGRPKLTIFASDASDQALEVARRGWYPAEIEEQVSAARLQRFFRRSGDGWDVERELRDAITFAAHDLLGDPPFAYLDMVSCRNVLIYLTPEAQERLLELFHFALLPGGILWLGTSETVGRRSDLFAEVSSGKQRIYRAIGSRRPGRHYPRRREAGAAGLAPRRGGSTADRAKTARSLERMVLERYTSPCVVVDRRLEILYLFGPTGDYLNQPQGEVAGDVLSWVRPELYAKLRAGLAEALEHTCPVTVTGVRLEQDTVAARIEIVIEPVTAGSSGEGLFSIVFRAMPSASRAAAAPGDGDVDSDSMTGQLKQDLEDARTELRTVVGQLRIAGEEHSASYEELLSLNEEFQSANEELEASKEELQSLNEELTTINSQLEEKNEELRTLTSDLNNLLVSTGVATIFLDRELRIRRFTPACSAVVSIGEADLGRALAAVPMRVRDDTVFAHAQRVLAEAPSAESAAESAGVPVDPSVLTAEVSTGDGRWFSRRVLPYRTETGDVDGVCLTYHEITQQKSAAAESERARHYAEAVIRTSRTPLLVLDRDHRVMSANDAFYSTFRIDRGEAEEERRTLYELADGQWDIPRVRTLLDEVVKVKGREVRDYGVDHVFGRIGWRSLRLNAQVMPRDDRPDLILVSIEDVTDLRLAEKVAEGRADELTKDDRRKNEFLAMLGHELRNPLSALSHGLELLRGSGGERIEPVREMMERQTRRMTAMLDQLLDVARVISGKFELTRNAADVAEVARAALESVAPMLEAAGHEVSVSLPEEGTVLVQGDEVRLAQVIENLLGNAVKYTQDGGRIELIAEATEETVEITVRDNGIGMAPDELDHMFDLFTQASTSLDRAKGGLGLGLPLVRSLVHMHEGEVRASSAGPGQGMEVVVTLPRLRRGRLLAGDSDEPARMPIASRRILVADDEGDTAFALAELLTLKGHQAQAVLDGNAALAAAAEFAPEIALIDLGLPGMDGYELAGRMRDLCGEGVHLVAVTGYSEDRDRLREAGFDGHLLKPLALDQLFALVGRLERGA